MSGKDLLLGMSFISDELVQEADSQPVRRSAAHLKWLTAAACLCLFITGGLICQALGLSGSAKNQESIFRDETEDFNGAVLQAPEQPESAAENVILWNFAARCPASDKVYPSPDTLFRSLSDSALPFVLLEEFRLDLTQAQPCIYRDPHGKTISVCAEITHSIVLPMEDLVLGSESFHPENYYPTMVGDSSVHFFRTEDSLRLARTLLRISGDSYLLVTVASDDLTEEQWLSVIQELLTFSAKGRE